MRAIRTVSGKEYPINWLSVYDSNSKLQFEIAIDDVALICSVFSKSEETETITDIYDSNETIYSGYTKLTLVDRTDLNRIVVRLVNDT